MAEGGYRAELQENVHLGEWIGPSGFHLVPQDSLYVLKDGALCSLSARQHFQEDAKRTGNVPFITFRLFTCDVGIFGLLKAADRSRHTQTKEGEN